MFYHLIPPEKKAVIIHLHKSMVLSSLTIGIMVSKKEAHIFVHSFFIYLFLYKNKIFEIPTQSNPANENEELNYYLWLLSEIDKS